MLGHDSTLPVTLDEMIFLTRAVTRAARRPLVVGDLPFGTYEVSDEQAVASAIRMVKEGGADVVKLEGAGRMVSRVRGDRRVEHRVMGHVGLTPQSATKLGGFKAQGRTADAAKQLYDDALALQEAGAFAIVLEAVPAAGRGARLRGARRADDRDRRRRRHRRPGARVARHARHVRRAARRASSSATRRSPTRSATRSRSTPPTCATGAFPEEQHTYGDLRRRSSSAFEGARSSAS